MQLKKLVFTVNNAPGSRTYHSSNHYNNGPKCLVKIKYFQYSYYKQHEIYSIHNSPFN